jgi:hypothetical protein
LAAQDFNISIESVEDLQADAQAQVRIGLAVPDPDADARGKLKAPHIQLPGAIDGRLHRAALDPTHVLGISVQAGDQKLRTEFEDR